MSFLLDLYRKLRKFRIVEIAGNIYLKFDDIIGTRIGYLRIKAVNRTKTDPNKKIKVGFIIQNPSVWNKNRSIYEAMSENPRIDAIIICVPDPFNEDTSTTYEWFCKSGYNCLDARTGSGPWATQSNKGQWIDLKPLGLDYVFYSQPYDHYLPVNLKSKKVSCFSKICISNYGICITSNMLAECTPRIFYRNVAIAFAQMQDEQDLITSMFPQSISRGIQKVEYFGAAGLDDFYKTQNIPTGVWDFSKNNLRVIWTPRWTIDEKFGGSNFFRYKDFLFDYAAEHTEIDFLFRPHPMALDNFVRIGAMTREDVDEFKGILSDRPNMALDSNADYGYTFWKSSFLVTDLSSIMAEYFVTGNPIIYCVSEHNELKLLPFSNKMLEGCYVVYNEQELFDAMEMLQQGNDSKKEIRKQLISDLFGEIGFISNKIADVVIEDYDSRS